MKEPTISNDPQKDETLPRAVRALFLFTMMVISSKPGRIVKCTRVSRMAKDWASRNCRALKGTGTDCPCYGAGGCRHPEEDRRHCAYLIGPLGWCGWEPHAPARLVFLGLRRDLLLKSSTLRARLTLAHEMAHERQRACTPSSDSKGSFARTVRWELEAEREALRERDQLAPVPRVASWIIAIPSAIRPVIAGIFESFGHLALPCILVITTCVILAVDRWLTTYSALRFWAEIVAYFAALFLLVWIHKRACLAHQLVYSPATMDVCDE